MHMHNCACSMSKYLQIYRADAVFLLEILVSTERMEGNAASWGRVPELLLLWRWNSRMIKVHNV
jgi:hypothetical protein